LDDVVRKDLLTVLKKSIPAIKKCDENQLKILSNQTIHNAGLYQDSNSISLAIIMYAFSKIFKEKENGSQQCQKMIDLILNKIHKAIENLKQQQDVKYEATIKEIFQTLSKLDKKFGLYITNVISQAKIKKASKVYEHGISAGRVAELMGVSQWELMSYLGKTKITDIMPLMTITSIQRLKNAREIFGLK